MLLGGSMGLGQYHRSYCKPELHDVNTTASTCRVSVDGFSSTLSEPRKEVTVVWRLSLHGAVLGLTSAKIHMP